MSDTREAKMICRICGYSNADPCPECMAPASSAATVAHTGGCGDGEDCHACARLDPPLYAAPLTREAATVPGGFKLVPIEPDDVMQAAGAQAVRMDTTVLNRIWTANAVFRAMVAAAPASGTDESPAEADSDALKEAGDSVTLTGAQLAEALDFIAPDRDADQLEHEATIQYGTGHSGKGIYCWVTDYPEEGAILLDGSTVAAAQPVADDTGTPLPRVHGVGRVADNPCALMLLLKREPSDDDLRSIHDVLDRATATGVVKTGEDDA